MAIKDIKFMNGEGYLLKDLPLSLDEYIKQMQLINYDAFYDSYRNHRDDSGVENTQFPPIIFAFYNVIFLQGKLPSPAELLTTYYDLNSSELIVDSGLVTYQNHRFSKIDLDARILRTYPSLVRDYHFYLMLVNAKCFDRVIYSCKNDIAGKDIIIQNQSKEYVVSLFVETSRSSFFKQIKNSFRHLYRSNEIQLPLDLRTSEKCGDFFIYSGKDLEYVASIILKKSKT